MDENANAQETQLLNALYRADHKTPQPEEAQDSEVSTQEEEPKEAESGEKPENDPEIEKKAAEAKAQELRQIEIDVHSLYNLAQHSPNFIQNPKFHMGGYIRVIGFLDKLGVPQAGPAPLTQPPQNRAARRRNQKEIDKGREKTQTAKEALGNEPSG